LHGDDRTVDEEDALVSRLRALSVVVVVNLYASVQ
jgi:hypothetical protein